MFIPLASNDAASSRLRCHGLARELRKLDFEVTIGYDATFIPDVLYLQKTFNKFLLEFALSVKKRGGLLVFDIDDAGEALPDIFHTEPQLFNSVLSLSDLVTVDTTERKKFFREMYPKLIHQIEVIPDPVDYFGLEDVAQRNSNFDGGAHGCWFGHCTNIYPALDYIEACAKSVNCSTFTIVTNKEFIDQLPQDNHKLRGIGWDFNTFADTVKSVDFCVLIHSLNDEGRQKSNNKMLAALSLGLIPFVSNTPSYASMADAIGFPELIIDSPGDLADRLTPSNLSVLKTRISSSDTVSTFIKKYSPSNVALIFLDILAPLVATEISDLVRLNLGCGNAPLDGFINVDIVDERGGYVPDIICDIRNLSAIPNNFADVILNVHVIEHFYYWELSAIFKEWMRVLKHGGILVIETPNLISACQAILDGPHTATSPGVDGQRSMWCLYGDPSWQDPLMCHRWLFSPQSLANLLHENGFIDINQEPACFKLKEPRDMRIVSRKPY